MLILRNTLAVKILGFGLEHDGLSLPMAAMIMPVAALACLCVGFLTRWVAWFCVGTAVIAICLVPGAHLDCAIVGAMSLSVALLGPGGFSVDFLRYGRLTKIYPPAE
jgi:uncharacterized membrane protein YphA (DoxX/SURF4 family)